MLRMLYLFLGDTLLRTIFQDFEGMAFGNLFSSGSDEIANSLLAILKSRTMMESVVGKMGLISLYKSDYMEEAVEILRDNLKYELLE